MSKVVRLRKKERTRQNICRAAAKLFAERSFEEVTVAQIALTADIDVSTFWRHFSQKSDLLLADLHLSLQAFEIALKERPKSEDGVCAVLYALATGFDQIDADMALIRGAALPNASTEIQAARARATESFRAVIEHELAARLATDPRHDPRPSLLSNLILSAVDWLRDHEMTTILASDVDGRFKRMREVITSLENMLPI